MNTTPLIAIELVWKFALIFFSLTNAILLDNMWFINFACFRTLN